MALGPEQANYYEPQEEREEGAEEELQKKKSFTWSRKQCKQVSEESIISQSNAAVVGVLSHQTCGNLTCTDVLCCRKETRISGKQCK